MTEAVVILALLLHRPVDLVGQVYAAGGLDAVAVVWCESNFRVDAVRREPGGTSWGLFQLYDKYHPQHRGDLAAHIREGARFLAECKQGRNFEDAVARYNGGTKPGAAARAWGVKVKAKRDDLAHSLWLRLR